jgi:hypothetical protein
MSKRKNTHPAPATQPLPQYEWPRPDDDLPRLSWADWLRLYALEVARSIPGAPGAFLAQYIGGLAEQALVLGAVDPDSHLALAQAEQECESAWIQALEAEAADPGGSWEPTDDITGSLDGHNDAAQQYWIGSDLGDLTYRN